MHKTHNLRFSFSPIFAAIAILLGCTFSVHAETPAPPAPAPAPAPANPGGATPKAEARREDVEPKILAEATGLLATARSDRDKAETGLTEEIAAHGKTKELLKSTLEIANNAKTELATVKGERDQAKNDLDAERAAHGRTKESLTLAESALGVAGVEPGKAVKASQEPPKVEKLTQDQWAQNMNDAKTPKDRAAVRAAFEKAIEEGHIATA